jgi:hypothetical protein
LSKNAFKEVASKFHIAADIINLIADASWLCIFLKPSEIMSFLFDEVDLVPSDIAAGLVILHVKNQMEAELALHRVTTQNEDDPTADISSPHYQNGNTSQNSHSPIKLQPQLAFELSVVVPNDPWNTPQIIAHFMKYALGMTTLLFCM